MHDCPKCKVPLHGHEEVCPSCGTKQYVSQGFISDRFTGQPEATVNLVPIVVTMVAFSIIFFLAVQFSWVGQMMNRGPVQQNPIDQMTTMQARQYVESTIMQGLAAVGAKGKLTWTSNGQPADKNLDQPAELAVETRLKDKEQRRAIIDPVKEYMSKAKIPTLTMTDTKSGATWTYTVSTPAAPSSDEDAAAPSPSDQQPAQQPPSQ